MPTNRMLYNKCYTLNQGLQPFFSSCPFKEIKKAIAPSNKTTQKTIISIYLRPFFLLFICNSRISSVNFKIFKLPPPFSPLYYLLPLSLLKWPPL